MKKIKFLGVLISAILTVACSSPRFPFCEEEELAIYPSYSDNLIIPCNIAPLNFQIIPSNNLSSKKHSRYHVFITACDSNGSALKQIRIKTYRKVVFGASQWQELTEKASQNNGFLRIDIHPHRQAETGLVRTWFVAKDSIDPYLIYRSGPHDENMGHQLQVYQRCIQNFNENLLMDNTLVENNCMNCHTICSHNASHMVIHLRKSHAGTLVIHGDTVVKLTIPPQYGFRLSYPDWHPSGNYIAFATTRINPIRYVNPYRTQDFMLDVSGRIVLYDIRNNRIFSTPELHDNAYQYSFPAWSPDGKTLYFCRAHRINPDTLSPQHEKQVLASFRYNLYQINFDPSTKIFDSLSLLYDFSSHSLSASIPSVSPDGRYVGISTLLMGSFPSQDQGDIALLDLQEKPDSCLKNADILNSPDSDRRLVWSSNGRWVIYSSKKETGANTLLHIAYFDSLGNFSTPFLLPQKNPEYYLWNTRSFIFPVLSRNTSKITTEKWREMVFQDAIIPDLSYFTPNPHNVHMVESGH